MNKLKLFILSTLLFWVSDILAVDLSGITPDDMQLFFNYLVLTIPILGGMLITPLAIYYGSQFVISAIYSMFAR